MYFHGNHVVWKPGIMALATMVADSHDLMVTMVYTHTYQNNDPYITSNKNRALLPGFLHVIE